MPLSLKDIDIKSLKMYFCIEIYSILDFKEREIDNVGEVIYYGNDWHTRRYGSDGNRGFI